MSTAPAGSDQSRASPRPNPPRASRPRTCVDSTERPSGASGRLLGRPNPGRHGVVPIAHGRGRRRPAPKRLPVTTGMRAGDRRPRPYSFAFSAASLRLVFSAVSVEARTS
jgi:hypothetical protein